MRIGDKEYSEDHCVADIIIREGKSFFDTYEELRDYEKELISSARSITGGLIGGGRCSDCVRKGHFKRNGSMVACNYYKTVARLLGSIVARRGRS
jgi:hypothetical protein